MNEETQTTEPKKTRNRSPEAKAFIRAQSRATPAREVVELGRKAGHIFSTGLVHRVRERIRESERRSHSKAYHAKKSIETNGHSSGHTRPARGGHSSDVQAALEMLVEALRAEAQAELRKKLSL